jgi:uncharacterized membrane protein YfbV (UPF0208 family)
MTPAEKAEDKFNNKKLQEHREDLQYNNGNINGLNIAMQVVRDSLREPVIMGMTDVTAEGKHILKILGEYERRFNEVSLKIEEVVKAKPIYQEYADVMRRVEGAK